MSSLGSTSLALCTSRTSVAMRFSLGTGCINAAMGAMSTGGILPLRKALIIDARWAKSSALTLDSPGESSRAGNTAHWSGEIALISA